MRTRECGPCALVAGDELLPASHRGAAIVITIFFWLGTFLLEGAEVSVLLAILGGAGISLGSGVHAPWALRLHLRISVAVGAGGRE